MVKPKGWVKYSCGWVSFSILESAPVPFGYRYYWDFVGVGPRGFGTKGLGTGLDNNKHH